MRPAPVAVVLALAIAPSVAVAAGQAWTIADPDQRAYCRAIETKSADQCSTIADFSLRETRRDAANAGR